MKMMMTLLRFSPALLALLAALAAKPCAGEEADLLDARSSSLTVPVTNATGVDASFLDSLPDSAWTEDGDGYTCTGCVGKTIVDGTTLLCHFCPDPADSGTGYCECTIPEEPFVCPIVSQPALIYGCGVGYSISPILAFIMVLVCAIIMACCMTDDLTKELLQEKLEIRRRRREKIAEGVESASQSSGNFPGAIEMAELDAGGHSFSFSMHLPLQNLRIRRFTRHPDPAPDTAAVSTHVE
ncbi:Hypothetical Protein FCC1311_067982 [Hondaea fermentalgiana]|uniref:Uncharacterized protein n=1 Tax=Hondaea fermentalgiana TaxID=2315210 RepID=A0A2R5GLF8_9STRA|nr:Hypothetical Protein FCC1311_067982 [Hondaea fermentalgiana]|eukprot:GBG30578.1 Hypothetical Protein FCC1311_067982 [Hondaea fermentalgiana]